MGAGSWSDQTYRAAATFRAKQGVHAFAYDSKLRSRPRSEWKADPSLDPKGVKMRESRDSDEHPNSLPIAVLFDVTGSMGEVPQIMQRQLSKLHGLIQRKGYVKNPQILFGAIGDADTDFVPLQVGQFESDNRMDEQLRTIFLEGNGGGQKSESYELAAYFMARHTATDAWEKRGHKGYLFIVGDELNKPSLKAAHIRSIIGDDVQEDLDVASIYRELQQRWDVFFILPRKTSYYDDEQVNAHWRSILGERFFKLEDPAAVCDLIGVTIGLLEDAIDLDEGLEDLKEIGSTSGHAVGKALATVDASRVAVATTALPGDLDGRDDLA
ncbi:hypothetical protein [Arthrobacter sp. NPDC093139]|uniref:hypothetical protein n=1 Tax=Arthrobacter sp. NPDC093139 TaxID=3363945 RepID=UPI00380778F2